MARNPRVHFPGALYHVILRGNNRQPIFLEDDDRLLWQSLLAAANDRYGSRVLCYCWMTNHVHLIVRVAAAPLGATVRYVASQYARQINRRQQRTGHLFERRHRAFLVGTDSYFKVLVCYIHRNPLRAGFVARVDDYRWSSHSAYTGESSDSWADVSAALEIFGRSRKLARQRYLAMVNGTVDSPQPSGALSTEASARPDAGQTPRIDPLPAASAGCAPSLEAIIERHLALSGYQEAELTGPGRARALAKVRTDIAVTALQAGAATVAELARRLNRSESAISQAVTARRYGRRQLK